MVGSRISRSSVPHGERGLSVRRRFSTSTVADDGRLVPWLAASGPLSYTPEDPPSRDYYFQYGWILSEIFTPSARNRRHFYFGASVKGHADELFAFWRAARASAAVLVACHLGSADASTRVAAPVAVYSARDFRGRTGYVLMQHGSYQFVAADEQPLLLSGEIVLYRGVHESDVFRFLRMGDIDLEKRRVWQSYLTTQAQMLSDSVLSFISIHDRVKRCETSHILDQSWVSDDIAEANGLDIAGDGFAGDLWRATHQGFTLARWVAEAKFGPHFVRCKTPVSNVRFTTFFAGEQEVRIIDPDLVEFSEPEGCRVERHGPSR